MSLCQSVRVVVSVVVGAVSVLTPTQCVYTMAYYNCTSQSLADAGIVQMSSVLVVM